MKKHSKSHADNYLNDIVFISSYTALGDLNKLKTAFNKGLDSGLTIKEIQEIVVQLYAYTGFPRSLNALELLMNVVEERKNNGVNDQIGIESNLMNEEQSSVEKGTEVQTYLVGQPVAGPLFEFVPVIDEFLKGHLFGDIFSRDILDYKTREVVTISALVNMEGVNSQLKSHFNMGINSGLIESQIIKIISFIDTFNKERAKNAKKIFEEYLLR